MEQAYRKSRRNLAIVAGLLLLVLFVGLEPVPNRSFQLFPFQLKNPDLLPHILAVASIYLMYNTSIAWGILRATSERHRLESVDFWTLIIAASVVLAIYIYSKVLPPAREELSSIVSGFTLSSITAVIIAALSGTIAVIASMSSAKIKELRTVRIHLTVREQLVHELTNQDWMLFFNPKHKNARKVINFSKNGEIHEGQNENEHSWYLDGSELVITKEDGSLQNRFNFDATDSVFKSTNDPNADALKRGIADQLLIPVSNLSNR